MKESKIEKESVLPLDFSVFSGIPELCTEWGKTGPLGPGTTLACSLACPTPGNALGNHPPVCVLAWFLSPLFQNTTDL